MRRLLITLVAAFLIAPHLAAAAPRTYEEINRGVQSLYEKDVAWRQVNWQTCLIDGLFAARKQNKPLVLWIFIDRPIDDERC
jgi:hypothetical protein